MRMSLPLLPVAAAAALLAGGVLPAQAATLEGWALMPAATFSDGPTSGQFATSAFPEHPLPLVDKQPVQGFSGVLNGPTVDTFRVLTDNGFGAKGNSADALLRMYAVKPDFRTSLGGSGTVSAANYQTGAALPGFTAQSRISLADPDRKLGFAITADSTNYYDNPANPAVAPAIKTGRLLTGGDLDVESVRQDKSGNLWFGDEFGPFLVKTDATGKVLRSAIALPGVQSPQNPFLGAGTPNLPGSGGFEGLAIDAAGDTLYTLLERTVTGDAAGSLRINVFDIPTEAYTGESFLYKLDPKGTNIGDMTAIGENEFLVIERNGGTATTELDPFKKIFRIDTSVLDADGFALKTEVVDLMNIADPFDLNGDGSDTFTFPFVTIEDVLVVDADTLLVINDNNYPGGGGRGDFADNTEFLLINMAPVPEPQTYALMLAGLAAVGFAARRRKGD